MSCRGILAVLLLCGLSGSGLAEPPKPTLEPLVRSVDVSLGQAIEVLLSDGKKATVKLLELKETRDPLRDAVRQSRALVEVNGHKTWLTSANYELPQTVAGVRIDCPLTKGYMTNTSSDAWGLEADARLRLWPEGSPLMNPGTMVYPVKQRWFATSTQMANEPCYVDAGERPKNRKIYYHYGLDFGGCEGLVEVVAATDGLVVSARTEKLPGYDDTPVKSRYDVVYVLDARGWYYRYSHFFSIDDSIRPGVRVRAGQRLGLLGKEGGSGGWTHLHFDIFRRQPSGKWGCEEAYALAWEAYQRQYQPKLIAVARPHHVAWAGDRVTLDASRSWSAAGKIARHQWTFTDGGRAEGPRVDRVYDRPGYYSEILKITDARGLIDYDFAIVHVQDRDRPDQLPPSIHATYFPTFDLKPGDEVTFKVRTFATTDGEETWDFGDGSPAAKTRSDGNVKKLAKDGYAVITHRFARPGHYLVRAERTDKLGRRAVGHVQVRVAEPAYQVDVRADVKIPMRDGVELSANVFLPKADGKFPAILARTPYGKGAAQGGPGAANAARGFAFVSQDCRGKGASGGDWIPFVHDRCDGQDTYRWIVRQPWSNGKIGTTGGSYVGYTQWISAPGAGEPLKALFASVPLVDAYDDLIYVGGAYQLQVAMGWGSGTAGSPTARGWKREDWLRALPLGQWDTAIDRRVPYLRDWVAHPHFDDYWKPSSVRGLREEITAPIYVACGWYDLYAKSVFEHLNAVRAGSRSEQARRHQHLLMGPWTHGINRNRKVGDVDFGEGSLVDLAATQVKWFDHWLKGEKTDVDAWPPFRIFVMGRNQWRDEQKWPLERTGFSPYYFHSGGSANTLQGDGRLATAKPNALPVDRFVYDPDDPVPTAGGCNLGGPAGPLDQTKVEERQDVLVYTSDALTKDLEATGPVKVVLYAASDATDTDWTAKLVDVWPDGRAINLCDGILRARYRQSADKPTLIEPGKIYRYEIDLWVTSNVFLPGHRVRVEISSSNFPRFDRNPNTGHPFGADAERKKAAQTVYHDAEHPSHIVLPVIP